MRSLEGTWRTKACGQVRWPHGAEAGATAGALQPGGHKSHPGAVRVAASALGGRSVIAAAGPGVCTALPSTPTATARPWRSSSSTAPESDWVRNVLAGGGQVVRAGRTHELLEARLVDPRVEPVPRLARPLGRLTHTVLLARLGPARSGFGRGPAADSIRHASRTRHRTLAHRSRCGLARPAPHRRPAGRSRPCQPDVTQPRVPAIRRRHPASGEAQRAPERRAGSPPARDDRVPRPLSAPHVPR